MRISFKTVVFQCKELSRLELAYTVLVMIREQVSS